MGYGTFNWPGVRCYTHTPDCLVDCSQAQGFSGPCSLPKFWSIWSSANQPPNWNILNQPGGLLAGYANRILHPEEWTSFGGIFPPYFAWKWTTENLSPGKTTKMLLRIYQTCLSGEPEPPTETVVWGASIEFTNPFTQTSKIVTAQDMGEPPTCSGFAWPEPPFNFWPWGCCDGNPVTPLVTFPGTSQ